MVTKIFFALLFFQLTVCTNSIAQIVPVPPIPRGNIPQVNHILNRISCGDINSFYSKLVTLKVVGSGKVNIVHIGDSHIQADLLTGEVRRELQQIFGNAGRGLLFPYQLATSNAPDDISCYSNTAWQSDRLVHSANDVPCGIAGFGIQTNKSEAEINISLKPNDNAAQTFKTLKFFLDDQPSTSWLFSAGELVDTIKNNGNDSTLYRQVNLQNSKSSFSLSLLSADTIHSFYGVSAENGRPGILYHAIGVNGARYDQYNNTPLFWKQLPGLQADLYIISMGTNEAQANSFDEAAFTKQVTVFLQQLKQASPNAAVLITTAVDSYKGRRSNSILQKLNSTLFKYCSTHHIAFWDLYRITNGYGAARNWLRKGLMNKDRIHFKPAGYQLQGKLLVNAMLNGYNSYSKNN